MFNVCFGKSVRWIGKPKFAATLQTPVATLETRKNWMRLSFSKTSGTVSIDAEKWPIAGRRFPSNDPGNNCMRHFGSSSLLASKVVKGHTIFHRGMTAAMRNIHMSLSESEEFSLLNALSGFF